MIWFKCRECDTLHFGSPALGAEEPYPVAGLTTAEREGRCLGSSDAYVVDDRDFYIRGNLDIPVLNLDGPFTWGIWVSLSRTSFVKFAQHYDVSKRAHIGPFFGWLATGLPYQPSTLALKAAVHIRDDGIRPSIELEPTDHPLAIEQRHGITVERLEEIYTDSFHRRSAPETPA